MIVCGYTLDLYCDCYNPNHEYNEFPHTWTGELGSRCRAQARKAGWIIRSTDPPTAICPKCRAQGRTPETHPKPDDQT